MQLDVWGAGPFDNAVARESSMDLTRPDRLRSELRESAWQLAQRPSSPCHLGYAAAEIVAAAMAEAPYWQCELQTHPLGPDGSVAGTFYLPPEIDAWIRAVRPQVPIDVCLAALDLVEQLIEQADLWPQSEVREWYLRTSARHLEAAIEGAAIPAVDDGDDELI